MTFAELQEREMNSQRPAFAAGGTLVSALPLAANSVGPSSLTDPITPMDALRRLEEGNQRFTRGTSLASNRDMDRIKAIAARQTPFAVFLGCVDSRVPVEIVFDQGFGDLVVARIAGNVAANEIIGSLEFGTKVLGAKVIYILGHTNCGAIIAAMKGEEVPGQISGLFQYIRPAVKASQGDLNQAVRENVRNQAILIAESSPVISKLIQRKELIVTGGVYDLQTGIVEPIDLVT